MLSPSTCCVATETHIFIGTLIKKWICTGENCSLDEIITQDNPSGLSHRCPYSTSSSLQNITIGRSPDVPTAFSSFLRLCPFGITLHCMSCLLSVLDANH